MKQRIVQQLGEFESGSDLEFVLGVLPTYIRQAAREGLGKPYFRTYEGCDIEICVTRLETDTEEADRELHANPEYHQLRSLARKLGFNLVKDSSLLDE